MTATPQRSVFVRAAQYYLRLGLTPIPCQVRDKRPLVYWKRYQTGQPTEAQIRSWWTTTPAANLALVLGHGTFALDLDGAGAETLLEAAGVTLPGNAPRVRTGNGQHVYFASRGAVANRTRLLSTNGRKPQVDVRGDGGYVLSPPSVHPSGARYLWTVRLEMPLPPAPEALLHLVQAQSCPTAGHGEGRIASGERNHTLASLAGSMRRRGMSENAILAALLVENAERCQPPLAEAEVRSIVRSIARYAPATARAAADAFEVLVAQELKR